MKHSILFIILFSLSLYSFAQYPSAPNEKDAEGRRVGRWTILFDKNFKPTDIKDSVTYFRVITYQKGIPSGKVYDYYISGALQTEATLLSDQPEDVYDGMVLCYFEKGNLKAKYFFNKGILEGKYEEYHPNGVVHIKAEIKNGKAEGLWEYFYDNGKKSALMNYSKGMVNGQKLLYSPDGILIEKVFYKDDKKFGFYEAWFENGIKEQEGNFIDDKKTGLWKSWFENGAKNSLGNFHEEKKIGLWKYFYENDSLKSEGTYINGLHDGEWKYFHINGNLKSQGQLKNGLWQGKWSHYITNGKLEEICHYVNDTLNGQCIDYYESGKLMKKGEFKKGKKNGYWEEYYENGKLQKTLTYDYGDVQGLREMYSENGILVDKVFFEKDTMTGPYSQYYDNGTIKLKGYLLNGKKEGLNEEYFPDGQIQYKAQMHNDLNDGLVEQFYPNGNLLKKGTFKNGVQEGDWEYFYENGKLQAIGKFSKGKKEGIWEWYFENGQLDGKGNVKNGFLNGYWEEFYPNGKLKQKGLYADSANKEGPWVFYYDNGQLDRKGSYKNGYGAGLWEYYHSNGAFYCKGKFDKGKHGTWIYYDSLGNKTDANDFKHGLREGKCITYKNNQIDTTYTYHNDVLFGTGALLDSINNEIDKHHYDNIESLIVQLQKIEQAQYPKNSPYRYIYLRKYADLYHAKKEYDKSIKYSLVLLGTLEKNGLDTSEFYSAVQNNLANTYSDLKKFNLAFSLYNKSLKAESKNMQINNIRYFTIINNISQTYKEQGNLDSARIILENYLLQVKEKYGEVDSSYFQCLEYLARLQFDQKEYAKGNNYYFYIIHLLEKKENTKKAEYRYTLSGIVNNYQMLMNYDSSFYFIKKVEKIYRSENDTSSGYYFYTLKRLANYFEYVGKVDSAFYVYSSIIEKMRANPYIEYDVYITSIYAMAGYYYDLQQYEEALKLYNYLKLFLENNKKQPSKIYGNTLETIAYIYTVLYTDKNNEAITLFETSVQNKLETFGPESIVYLYAVSDLTRFYSHINDHYNAVTKGKTLIAQIEQKVGKNNELYAHHSEVMGDILYNSTNYDQALPYYRNAHGFYAANKKYNFVQYIDLVSDLANCLKNQSKEEESEKLYLGAMQEVDTRTGKENIQYIKLTKNLIDLYEYIDRDNAAKYYLKEIIPITKKITGEESGYYFGFINRLAEEELKLGLFNKSDSLLSILKSISLKYHGPSSSNYQIYLKEKANLEYTRGNYKEADLFYISALRLTAKLFEKNSEEYASLLKKVAIFYKNTARYTESEDLLILSIENIKAIYGSNVLNYAYYVAALASTYDRMASYAKAEKYYDEAISIYEKKSGKNSWNYLNTMGSKAKMYVSAGLFNKAKEAYEEYLKIMEDFQGKETNYALALSGKANLYRQASSFRNAIDCQLQSQQIISSINSVESPQYINGLNVLGLIYLDANQLDSASFCFNEYKRLVTKLYPTDSLSLGIYYNNYAVVCHQKGNYSEAEKLLGRTFKIDKEFISNDPKNYINFYDNYAKLYTSWNKLDKAEKYWGDVLSATLNYTTKMFGEFTEQEKSQFWSEYSKNFEIYNSFCLLYRKTKPDVLQGMYNNRIATKAIVLNSIDKLKKRIYSSHDTTLVKKYEGWQLLRDQTARYHGIAATQLAEAGISLDSLEKVQEHLEKELSISVDEKKQNKSIAVTWKDIQKKLLPSEAAVEIIQFRHYTTSLTDSIVYAALILTAETKENPELVILPFGNKLETRYLSYYKNAIKFKSLDTISYNAYWKPLEEKLKGITTLYISLDGVYNQININTLMLPDNSYLLDKRKIIIVSNTKDILPLKLISQVSKNNSSQGVHLFGYPDYDEGLEKVPTKIGKERGADSGSDFTRKNSITRLPGTKVEMEKIVALLADKQWRFRSYLENQASEDFVKQLQSPLVLHIATHGFFLGEEQVKLGADETGYMNGQKYNPLLMSGLFLSGAAKSLLGYSSQEGENGILTALEASTLNLDNTELVILSACETGKGEIKVGEGVYGLQRAFQVAGSKATIMSLWKVDDNATQQLMESFYKNWIESGNKTEAFRIAQLEVRQNYKSPYYWGAFVMMGQ